MANTPTTNLPMISLTREAMSLELNCACGGVIRWNGSYEVRIVRDMTLVNYNAVCTECDFDGLLMTGDARDDDTSWSIDYDPEGVHFSGIGA